MRACLVLGGGGPIGIAWEAGLLLGLAEGGLDLAKFTLIIGTSAGSITGAHLAGAGSVDQLYSAQATSLDAAIKPPNMLPLLAAYAKAKIFARGVEKQRLSLGKSARRANVENEQQWLDIIAGFLPQKDGVACSEWPDRDFLVTAIDAESGELVAWDRKSKVPLPIAVASSCAVPCVYPLVHIGGRPYMDGGMGSPTNASLGAGSDVVVVADPLASIMGRQSPLLAERAKLLTEGSKVATFQFDAAIKQAIGINLMDAGKRGLTAELGRAQGRRAAMKLGSGSAEAGYMASGNTLEMLRR